jgi:hypothetical protein
VKINQGESQLETTTTTPTTAKTFADSGIVTVGRWLVAAMAWIAQYCVYVWCAIAWRTFKSVLKSCGFVAFLVFVPVIGWIALWVILRGRKRDGQHAELIATMNGTAVAERSLWSPWLLDWARN